MGHTIRFSEKTMSPHVLALLCKRYLFLNPSKYPACPRCTRLHESSDSLLDRVSFGIGEYRTLLETLDFLPNSPTLFNAGTERDGTLSACFKFNVADTLLGTGGIMDVATKAAAVQKFGGGVGYCLSDLRPKGAHIESTHGQACGPVSVMKHLYHGVAMMITQGGKREGAQMGILHCDHQDIREFIHCKDQDPQGLSTFNISVAITDRFMTEAIGNPRSEQAKLLHEMAESAWRTGDPGCYFIDAAERGNPTPWIGKVDGSNPCGEVPLMNNEPCNLGSINLVNFVENRRIQFDRLKNVVPVAVRYLDHILDQNTFPHEAITEVARKTRKLGLGVMGWADMLALMHIPYDSDEAVGLGEDIMREIQSVAHQTSKGLGKEKGMCPALAGHKGLFFPWERRNATLTCIAPTGTISTIAGVSNGIEPHFSLKHTRTTGDGTKFEETPYCLKFDPYIPHVSHEIAWEWHIKHQAAFQKHTDLAVSKTCNMPESATVDEVRQAYIRAWESGCKGTTVYRDGSRAVQVLDARPPVQVLASKSIVVPEIPANGHLHPKSRPRIVAGKTYEIPTGHGEPIFVTVNRNPDPFEVFATMGKAGGCAGAQMEAIGRLVSLALRSGVAAEEVVHQLSGIGCCPQWVDGVQVKSPVDAIAYALRADLGQPIAVSGGAGEVRGSHNPLCPEGCGGVVVMAEGCMTCSQCGWSKCG